MKIAEGLKIIENQWIQKPKGFRVKYQKFVNLERLTEYSPGKEDSLLDSDVTAWRYAWKLFMSTRSKSNDIAEGEFINIGVVDESDHPVHYYVTGKNQVLNPK
ncbi:MAG: hypothetical protein KKE44_17165 [Proteobacteria bacterium]|nr:hypothetical protein [Pseudomonadota bacterium]MBU1584461.1 hypothetical protein [Pseudomonadota bacterium]MBU2452962.1 hypothetical protein [Pseudomonadota bacterium]MBU2628336.1 hypothetical protein [Pseudomonadota bacterium]